MIQAYAQGMRAPFYDMPTYLQRVADDAERLSECTLNDVNSYGAVGYAFERIKT